MKGLQTLSPSPSETTPDFLRLHHVGFVVKDIASSIEPFVASVSGSWDKNVFHDPIQKVKVAFLCTPGTDVQIELVEPAAELSPVRAFLEKGGGLHHLCYEVNDCEETLSSIRQRRGIIVKRPQPAVAFGGRRIAWALTAEKLLLEFVEVTLK
jgi:methylmalonyl-CoA/ethylmalonyl-CoA epimerase